MGHVSDPHGFEGSLGNSGADGGKLKIACAGAESMYLPAEQFHSSISQEKILH